MLTGWPTPACLPLRWLSVTPIKFYDDSIVERAAKELGLGFELSQDTNAGRLFFDNEWPEKFQAALAEAKTPLQRAEVAVKRIEHFIKTNGKE